MKQIEQVTHELKTWSEYFRKVRSGEKTFEVRKNDRNFQIGDTLVLKEWNPIGYNSVAPNELEGVYTGEQEIVKVTYVLQVLPHQSALFGISSDTVVMSIKKLNKVQNDEPSVATESASSTVAGQIPFPVAIKSIRDYFGEHDKSQFEHWAYSYLNKLLQQNIEKPEGNTAQKEDNSKAVDIDSLAEEIPDDIKKHISDQIDAYPLDEWFRDNHRKKLFMFAEYGYRLATEQDKGVLTLISHMLQIAREDLQYKAANGDILNLFKDFQLLNAIRSDVLQLRDKYECIDYSTFSKHGFLKVKDFIDVEYHMKLKEKFNESQNQD